MNGGPAHAGVSSPLMWPELCPAVRGRGEQTLNLPQPALQDTPTCPSSSQRPPPRPQCVPTSAGPTRAHKLMMDRLFGAAILLNDFSEGKSTNFDVNFPEYKMSLDMLKSRLKN